MRTVGDSIDHMGMIRMSMIRMTHASAKTCTLSSFMPRTSARAAMPQTKLVVDSGMMANFLSHLL